MRLRTAAVREEESGDSLGLWGTARRSEAELESLFSAAVPHHRTETDPLLLLTTTTTCTSPLCLVSHCLLLSSMVVSAL